MNIKDLNPNDYTIVNNSTPTLNINDLSPDTYTISLKQTQDDLPEIKPVDSSILKRTFSSDFWNPSDSSNFLKYKVSETPTTKDIIAQPFKSTANLATFPLRVGADVAYNIPKETISLAKGVGIRKVPEYFAQGLAQTEINIARPVLKFLLKMGNTGLGALQAGIKTTTGVDLNDKQAEQAFLGFKNILKSHKLDTAIDFTKSVNRLVTERPEDVLLIADQTNKVLTRITGNPVDVISTAAKPITIPYEKVVDKLRVANTNAIAEYVNNQLGLKGKKAGLLQKRNVDPGQVVAENTGARIPEPKGKLEVDNLINTLDEKVKPGYDAIREAIKQNNVGIDTPDFYKRIVQEIDNNPRLNGLEKLEAKQQLPGIINELEIANKKSFVGETRIRLDGIQDIKQQAGKASRYDLANTKATPPYRNAMQGVNRASMLTVEDNLPIAARALNRQLGMIEETINILDTKRGVFSAVKGGYFGRVARPVIGGVIGSQSGPLQGIIGATIANPLMETIAQLPIEVRSMMLMKAVKEGNTALEKILTQTEKILEKGRMNILNRPRLPSPTTIYGEEYKGSESRIYSQEEILRANRPEHQIQPPPPEPPLYKKRGF